MPEFSIMFFSLKSVSVLDFQGKKSQLNILISEFVTKFEHTVTQELFSIKISCLQKNTSNLRKKINDFVKKYKSIYPNINGLNTFFQQLDKDEYFYIIPNIKELSNSQLILISNELLSHNDKNINLEELQKKYIDMFESVWTNYEMIAKPINKKIKIGEGLKNERICRFCKKSKKEKATFIQEAHAISEALGNKTLILNEECDVCNTYFSQNCEKDIITYLKIFTTFFGIKNKNNKISKIKGKNFEYINDGERNIIIRFTTDNNIPKEAPPENIPLMFYDKIITQNIYKALCKFALSIIESINLLYFNNTIEWIRTDKFYEELPKIAVLPSYNFFNKQPQMYVYIRKNENKDLPYAVGKFHFTFLTFVFIIPTFTDIDNKFLNDNDYNIFWNCFKHYKETKQWTFEDFSNHDNKEIVFNIKLKQNKK